MYAHVCRRGAATARGNRVSSAPAGWGSRHDARRRRCWPPVPGPAPAGPPSSRRPRAAPSSRPAVPPAPAVRDPGAALATLAFTFQIASGLPPLVSILDGHLRTSGRAGGTSGCSSDVERGSRSSTAASAPRVLGRDARGRQLSCGPRRRRSARASASSPRSCSGAMWQRAGSSCARERGVLDSWTTVHRAVCSRTVPARSSSLTPDLVSMTLRLQVTCRAPGARGVGDLDAYCRPVDPEPTFQPIRQGSPCSSSMTRNCTSLPSPGGTRRRDSADVWMRQLRDGARLALESIPAAGSMRARWITLMRRNDRVACRGAIDLAHAAGAEQSRISKRRDGCPSARRGRDASASLSLVGRARFVRNPSAASCAASSDSTSCRSASSPSLRARRNAPRSVPRAIERVVEELANPVPSSPALS